MLSRPQDRWPNLFLHPFWNEYPYFLLCLFSAAYALVSISLAAIFLKEVGSPLVEECRAYALLDCRHTPRRKAQYRGQFWLTPSGGPTQDTEMPPPLRTLLTRPVVVSITNYCMIALLEIMGGSLMLLVWSTVDVGSVGRARNESCIHWFVDGRIWTHERNHPICRLPAHSWALRPTTRLHCQHLLFYPNLHPSPPREPSITPFNSQLELRNGLAHRAAAHADFFCWHGIRWVSENFALCTVTEVK